MRSDPDPLPFLPYGRQHIDASDIQAVVDVLQSEWLTCGPTIESFEQALATACQTEHAVALANGTAALHLALLAAGVGPGDRVLTSANTFLASANAAEYVGAVADFADIDPVTRCISIETLAKAWKPDVKAVVAVDFAGYPCVSEEMADFIHQRGAIVIEDACHALGSTRASTGTEHVAAQYPVGGLPWVDLTTFSFHPVKTIACGEGGAVLTRQKKWAESIRRLRNHGMIRPDNPADALLCPYTMEEPGFNYRITDIQCALGLSQLRKLSVFAERRRQIVAAYDAAFSVCPSVRSFAGLADASVCWHVYALWMDFDAIGCTRTRFRQKLQERGIGTQIHYYPVHLQPYYARRYGYARGKCPVAEDWYDHCLSLPLFPAMTDTDIARVIEAVREIAHGPLAPGASNQ
jgi:perosamine synthetase